VTISFSAFDLEPAFFVATYAVIEDAVYTHIFKKVKYQ